MATLTSKLIVELIDRATGPAKRLSATLGALNAASARNSARLNAISGKLIGTGAAAFALGKGLGAPIKVGAQFESLLEDIRQKGSLAAPELKALGLSLRNIASATNALLLDAVKSFNELLGLGCSSLFGVLRSSAFEPSVSPIDLSRGPRFSSGLAC